MMFRTTTSPTTGGGGNGARAGRGGRGGRRRRNSVGAAATFSDVASKVNVAAGKHLRDVHGHDAEEAEEWRSSVVVRRKDVNAGHHASAGKAGRVGRKILRRNSIDSSCSSVTASMSSVGSLSHKSDDKKSGNGAVNETEWRNFLSGLDGAIRRASWRSADNDDEDVVVKQNVAAIAPSSSSSRRVVARTRGGKNDHRASDNGNKEATVKVVSSNSCLRRSSLGDLEGCRQVKVVERQGPNTSSTSATALQRSGVLQRRHPPMRRYSSLPSSSSSNMYAIRPPSPPSSQLYPDLRPRSALRKGRFSPGERLFVDVFLARSERCLSAQTEPELRFDTPTVHHLSGDGSLQRTERSWSSSSSSSEQQQQLRLHEMRKCRKAPVRRNSMTSVSA
mmetsp:Transcript_10714/g.20466  ORF Transcript_10714/g.20466 Transcript_10714/m.20466 type:complete len:391 (-) Transcript_10714:58-1230(-)